LAEVLSAGAITAGRKGERLAEMANMARGGAAAFSDDGKAVADAALLRQALLYAKMLNLPILEHCEDPALAANGVMNEGAIATELGLPAVPAEAEEIIVARDILLAKLTGARLHLQHVSTRGSVAMLRHAKDAGLAVTAEVTPHHLTLTEENLRGYNPVFKVNPPLRTPADVAACVAALADRTIDAIATDHAPHLQEEKEVEIAEAPFGLLGLETAFGVIYTHLVKTGKLPLARAIEALTAAPAKILNLPRGTLAVGAKANLTVWDLAAEWNVEPNKFKSKSRNCPWNGRQLCGNPVAVFVGGEKKL
jgi:dihydroorotase